MKTDRIVQTINAAAKNLAIKVESFLDLFSNKKLLRLFAISICCIVAFIFRVLLIYHNPPPVVDFLNYSAAAQEFLTGKNVYKIFGTQAYATKPAVHLYLTSALYIFSTLVGESHLMITRYFLFCMDIIVGLLIYKILDNNQFWNSFLGLTIWVFNPFTLYNSSHAKYEVVMIFFMLLAFFWLEKGRSEIEATVFLTLSLLVKPLTLLMIPMFLYKSQDRIRNAGIIVGLFFILSLPFLIEPLPYLHSLTHNPFLRRPAGDQGFGIFAQIHTLYSYVLSKVLATLILIIIYIKFRRFNIYFIGVLVFIVAVSFHSVLFKQYFVWFVPFLIIAILRNLRFNEENKDELSIV